VRLSPDFSVITRFINKSLPQLNIILNSVSDVVSESVNNPDGVIWDFLQPFAWRYSSSVKSNFSQDRFLVNNVKDKLSRKSLLGNQDWADTQIELKEEESKMDSHGKDQSHRSGQVDRDKAGREKIYPISQSKKPVIAEYVIQEHHAVRAGEHWDFQINLNGYGHRWVIKKMRMPPPGEPPLKAIQQPTHAPEHVDFKGTIKEGYGEGEVYQIQRGQCEVLFSDNNNVDFVIYEGEHAGHYKMKRWHIGADGKSNVLNQGKSTNEWLLISKKDGPEYPPHLDRPVEGYTDVKREFSTNDYIITEKYDGTHSVLHINKKKYGRNVVASRRKPKESNKNYRTRGGILHQEDNLPHIRDMEIAATIKVNNIDLWPVIKILNISPDQIRAIKPIIHNTNIIGFHVEVVDYQGCVFHVEVMHPKGHAFTGGILNSHPIRAMEIQEKEGNCRVILLDVKEYQGKNVEDMPYEERWKMMDDFARHHPEVEIPDRLKDDHSHREFHNKIISEGGEGTCAHHKEAKYGDNVYKIKGGMDENFRKDYIIIGFTEGKGKYENNGIGAIVYSDRADGRPLGKVGGGLSDEQRRDIFQNKDRYIGSTVTIESNHKIKDGKAVRAPSVYQIDQGSEPIIKE
jgi:hypothetical protein